LLNEAKLRGQMIQRELAPCKAYVPNLQLAVNDGECICGIPRGDHTLAALQAGGRSSKKLLDAADLREQMIKKEQALAPCEAYMPNLQGAFGECVCGRQRSEHTNGALFAGSSEKA